MVNRGTLTGEGLPAQSQAAAQRGGIGGPPGARSACRATPDSGGNEHPEQAGERDGEEGADDSAELETKRESEDRFDRMGSRRPCRRGVAPGCLTQ